MVDFATLKPIVNAILDDYPLAFNGVHGVNHWARVLENGLLLAEQTGADVEVVVFFALFHDSKRLNEHNDSQHGARGGAFAEYLHGDLFELRDSQLRLLVRACEGHTHERTHPDVTIQTCWDSDRLDLGRIGITPHASRLCTDVAKMENTIRWAHGRACMNFIPDFVSDAWDIELA